MKHDVAIFLGALVLTLVGFTEQCKKFSTIGFLNCFRSDYDTEGKDIGNQCQSQAECCGADCTNGVCQINVANNAWHPDENVHYYTPGGDCPDLTTSWNSVPGEYIMIRKY